MNKEEINKKIASSLFKMMLTISEGKYYTLDKKGNLCEIPDYFEDLDSCYSIIDFFKKRGYSLNIGYDVRRDENGEDNIYWSTKISKNKITYTHPEYKKTLTESICCASLSFINREIQKKDQEENIFSVNNIVLVDFKKDKK